jgi:hypothetical protein
VVLEVTGPGVRAQGLEGKALMWRRLLVLFGFARQKAPQPDMANVIDFQQERLRRTPVILGDYVRFRMVPHPVDPADQGPVLAAALSEWGKRP